VLNEAAMTDPPGIVEDDDEEPADA
jgi:hypothetical protein